MPRSVQHLHPLLLANIDRVKDKQAPLSLTEFEQIYCEPAETTQPQAHSTSAQPPGSYHAVAPPSTTPEAIVHFHSYNITTEDYPALEDLTNADAPDPASHPQPPTADTSSADSGQQPAQNPPAAEPRTLAPPVSLVIYDQRNTGITIARKQIAGWPTPITDSNDTLHARHNCARDGRRTMLEGTPAPDHPNRLHTLSKAIEKLGDRTDMLQDLYHKVQDHVQTLLVYVTEEPPYAMYVGVRLLPQDEPIALGDLQCPDTDICLRNITMMSHLTPVAPWVEKVMRRLQQDLRLPFNDLHPLVPFPPGAIPAPTPPWPGYNNPGYARADYTNIEDAPTFVITSSLDSGSNNSESDEQSVHAGNDDMDLEEQAAPTAPWFVEHLPRWSPKIPTNYHEAGAFSIHTRQWTAQAGMIFTQADYDKHLQAQQHVLQVQREYEEINRLICARATCGDGVSHHVKHNGIPLRCTNLTTRLHQPGADGFTRCCIIHRRMEAQRVAQVASDAWHGYPTTPIDAVATNDGGATTHSMSCMARTLVNHQPLPASFRRTGLPDNPINDGAAHLATRTRLPASTSKDPADPPPEHDTTQVLIDDAAWTEEALEQVGSCLSASAITSDTQHVPREEVVRLITKGAASKSKEHARFFGRTAICYTVFNNDAKKGMLFFNQRSGVFQQYHCIIVDTGSMVLVMNRRHVQALGLGVRTGTTIVDTSLGSAGTQTHQSWGSGELMIVASPGTSHEIVVLDVPGISPDADVKFDVLLSVQA
ncbi:hypothetical protein CYMTET_39501 [Cymbomonas tetramitiformis]|uniref:Uncharacterized protein n=1 Tax=Cymbomonas tetramitiformis TaxID=36881 RepID=A0AAE0CBA8_9CHLO|nr:hypothetical protein CYMTET_39501 [Cymbomonas tetramitiformis]